MQCFDEGVIAMVTVDLNNDSYTYLLQILKRKILCYNGYCRASENQ